ncbi:MAG: FAD-binding oxidoreductase [Deltaproteobacteria bacterium]|nr:FAD-binding oxidoreductase [Deltaproteobacteria bacterium]
MSRSRAALTLAGWGRVPVAGHEISTTDLTADSRGAALLRGLGRSYGDSSLPAHADDRIVNTCRAARVIAWDATTGRLRAEAGLALADMNALTMPAGWFTPVTPGTKFVTLGGMVASDVHGKNHHRDGCFGGHVTALRMRVASGDVLACGPAIEPELFWATVGGMGLTGHILEVEVQLHRIPSPWIWTETSRVDDLDGYLAALAEGALRWPMTVGWIDCLNRGRRLGRGILMAGRWATADEAPARFPGNPWPLRLPFDLPNWALNDLTASAFNSLYYWRHLQRHRAHIQHPDAFFYPLDRILDWNRAYGPRGFTQYQCVLPRAAGPAAVHEFMELLTRLGGASPLCVIKDCGPEGQGVLSFPLEGTSVAVDMAITADTQRIVDELNAMVIAAGGRIYLSKDLFTRAADFRRMEPRLDRFLAIRERWDPTHAIRSAQSVRLFGY